MIDLERRVERIIKLAGIVQQPEVTLLVGICCGWRAGVRMFKRVTRPLLVFNAISTYSLVQAERGDTPRIPRRPKKSSF